MAVDELRAIERVFESAAVVGRVAYVSANTRGTKITIDGEFDIAKLIDGLKPVVAPQLPT